MTSLNKQLSFSRSRSTGGKSWVHSSETLTNGRVVYTVKFLGHVEVDQPKGSDMVRDAIRKMKFNKQIKKAEGQKPPKVELLISIDAVAIQEPKSKIIQYQYPLHQVSYCADDKSDKKMFTFIAKDKLSDKHHCFVFDSDKCAEEITLTLGQAFDLAYRRFLDSSAKNVDAKKQLLVLQQKVQELTLENTQLKERITVLEKLLDYKKQDSVHEAMASELNGVSRVQASSPSAVLPSPQTTNGTVVLPVLAPPPPIPSRSHIPPTSPVSPSAQPLIAQQGFDAFGAVPFTSLTGDSSSASGDVFGMPAFSPVASQPPSYQFQHSDHDIMDMQANFSRGLSIGTEDFSLDDFDPCKK